MDEMFIFAATENDMRVFSLKDKRIYLAIEQNGQIILKNALADTFDLYIQNMINKGDILNAPLEPKESQTETPNNENQ